jgi:hypothetical protein
VVRLVAAPPENLKVTTPADLHLAELLLAQRQSDGESDVESDVESDGER